MKRLRFCLLVVSFLSLNTIGLTATQPILIHVLDATGTEGVPGVVVLVSSVQSHKVRAYITDAEGDVFGVAPDGTFCTITALDPAGLFYGKTTESNCQSSPVTLILAVRPIIDKVYVSDSVRLKIVIHGADGKVLPKQSILLRPSAMTLETARLSLYATDENGILDAQLSAGEYTLATLVEGKPFEVAFLVAAKEKCPKTSLNCVSLRAGSHIANPLIVRLVSADTVHGVDPVHPPKQH